MLFPLFHQSSNKALTWCKFLEISNFHFHLVSKRYLTVPSKTMDFRLNPVLPFCDFLFTKSPIIFNLFTNSLYLPSTSSSSPILSRRHHYHAVDTDICSVLHLIDIIILLSTLTSVLFFFLSTSSSCHRHRHLLSSMHCQHHHLIVDVVIFFLLLSSFC